MNQKLVNVNKKKSRYRGLSWDGRRHQWIVRLRSGRYSKYCGRYRNEIVAALVYNHDAIYYLDDNARLNNVESIRVSIDVDKFNQRVARFNQALDVKSPFLKSDLPVLNTTYKALYDKYYFGMVDFLLPGTIV